MNPAAGGGRAASIVPGLLGFAKAREWHVQLRVTSSPTDLATSARLALETGMRRIFVVGGDGSFQAVLNAIGINANVVLAVIPAGGGNDLANALGLSTDFRTAAQLLLDGEVSEMDVVRVRTADGIERFYAGGGGVGLDALAVRFANGVFRNLSGRTRYILSLLRALWGFQSFRVTLRMPTGGPETIDTTALVTAVLNTPSYGAGVRLAPDAALDDGMLDVAIVPHLSLLEILFLLPRLVANGELRIARIERFQAQTVLIETQSAMIFQADGELVGKTPVEISLIPRAIRILRPSSSDASR